jgi:PqqD family protein of HPr-rel-A system
MIRPLAALNTTQTGWFSDPAFPLRVRHWDDDDYVIYHPGSGDTHLLDASRYLVLSQLGRQAIPTMVIAERLSVQLGLPDDAEFMEKIETLLSDLYGLGLIEKVG